MIDEAVEIRITGAGAHRERRLFLRQPAVRRTEEAPADVGVVDTAVAEIGAAGRARMGEAPDPRLPVVQGSRASGTHAPGGKSARPPPHAEGSPPPGTPRASAPSARAQPCARASRSFTACREKSCRL